MRRRVIALHFTHECQLHCPFCYERFGSSLPQSFWLGLPRYIQGRFEQVALGGGEPLLFPEFVRRFAKECHDRDITCNLTTNGRVGAQRIREACRWLDLVSVSLDSQKWPKLGDFFALMRELKGERFGVNLLMESETLDMLVPLVQELFERHAERVFLLHPKGTGVRLSKENIAEIQRLSRSYRELYVDDLTLQVATQGYGGWREPCHYGKDVVAVHPDGSVTGCSFEHRPAFVMREPSDLTKLDETEFEERYSCPFLLEVSDEENPQPSV
jgi:MoaA/NifB/PqqE/SkfB family radical SAM enzyme